MNRTKCVEEHRRRSNGPLTCEDCRAADIAAAEERGRRAGIEERDELRARLWEALSVIESRAPDMTLLIPRIKVALAPRDSGKECGYLLSRDLGAEWRCGKPKGHEGPHSGTKP